jgi:SHAQKYF class myb-like DNA-binding protein
MCYKSLPEVEECLDTLQIACARVDKRPPITIPSLSLCLLKEGDQPQVRLCLSSDPAIGGMLHLCLSLRNLPSHHQLPINPMTSSNPSREVRGVWSTSEHERFLEALAMYPQGPWPLITAHIGTRSAKQVQTHAQKYQHKLMRHQRGLRKWKTKSKRPEHRVDTTTADQLMNTRRCISRPSQRVYGTAKPTSTGSEGAASDYSGDSDCSSLSELNAWMEVIEPVPFQSARFVSSSRDTMEALETSEDHLLSDALDAILSWSSSVETDIMLV